MWGLPHSCKTLQDSQSCSLAWGRGTAPLDWPRARPAECCWTVWGCSSEVEEHRAGQSSSSGVPSHLLLCGVRISLTFSDPETLTLNPMPVQAGANGQLLTRRFHSNHGHCMPSHHRTRRHSSHLRCPTRLRNSAGSQPSLCSAALWVLLTRQARPYLEVWLPTGCCKGSSSPHSPPAANPSLPRVWNLHPSSTSVRSSYCGLGAYPHLENQLPGICTASSGRTQHTPDTAGRLLGHHHRHQEPVTKV